jgi:4-diphosphocytidyl-2-C-methyl-D-erythritol kinase
MEVTRYPAPGKLNLFLHVLGRRRDGYHDLQTVFRLVERADAVGIGVREDGQVRFSGPFGDDNLCLRAARLLKSESGTTLGCDLSLEKVLPVGGGMGGGSSAAATVLLVLNRLWRTGFPAAALRGIGCRLGADVPFFLHGGNALGEGLGEMLSTLELPPAWYLVLTPQVQVSTKEIFSDASLTPSGKRLKIPPFLSGQGRNDLQAVVAAKYPDVKAHLDWLAKRAAGARMTGSGACVFAEFKSEAEALALQSELPREMRGFVTRGLDRHPLHDWAD